MGGNHISRKYCHCTACIKFIGWHEWRFQNKGLCGLCGRVNLDLFNSAAMPQIIKDFFNCESLCWCCINVMTGEFYYMGLCWGIHSDEQLKWGLLALVIHKFREHLSHARPKDGSGGKG